LIFSKYPYIIGEAVATSRKQPSLQRLNLAMQRRGTVLGVFLFLADLMVLGDGECLILMLPPLRH
jgi:hypothetical protein